jgi:hypothetical protein
MSFMNMPKDMEARAEPALVDVIRENFASGVLVPLCKVENLERWGVGQSEWEIKRTMRLSEISLNETVVVHPYRISALLYFETISENRLIWWLIIMRIGNNARLTSGFYRISLVLERCEVATRGPLCQWNC